MKTIIPEHGWTCFHCGETFYSIAGATEHFGLYQDQDPACTIDIVRFRNMETLVAQYRNEDTDLHREMAKISCDKGVELRQQEEIGYSRGSLDQQKRCIRISENVKSTLRNGGARNACDDIIKDIKDPNVD